MKPHEYDLARMAAIKAYAELEHRLAYLLQKLIGCDADSAWAIFFRISSTRARYAIIGDLAKINHEGRYSKTWKLIESWLRRLDTTRNHIVHWTETGTTVVKKTESGDADVFVRPELRSPSSYHRPTAGQPSYSRSELVRYRKEIEEMAALVLLFGHTIHCERALPDMPQPQEDCLTPEDILRALRGETRNDPPQSSPA